MKTLTYLASLEVYYQCCKILEHFTYSSFWYCICDKYQGCLRGPYPVAGREYCCVCRTHAHYSLEKLNNIKHDSFELEKFYLNILRDLVETLSVDPTVCIWKGEVFYKHKNWQEGTEIQTCLRNVIDILFTINTD